MNIVCSQGDRFNITYELTPANTTRTQVDWEINNDTVVGVAKNYYTYSQGTTHTITFVANSAGEAVIKFKPKNTDKWTQANVTVGKAESTWPSFCAPEWITYNANTGLVTWKAVSKMLDNGIYKSVSYKSDGSISGLTGYIVHYKKYEINSNGERVCIEEYQTPENTPQSECTYALPSGYSYEINVYAKGDKFSMKDSPVSDTLRYHQLASVNNLSNNNGKISFNTSIYSQTHTIWYAGSDDSKKITTTSNGAEDIEFYASERFTSLDKYTISVKSYPTNYDVDTKTETNIKLNSGEEAITYVLNKSDGYRYYPSAISEQLVVENLTTPTFTTELMQGEDSVNAITFGDSSSTSAPYIGSKISWGVKRNYSDSCAVQYKYTIYKNTSGNNWEELLSGTGNSYDLSNLQNSAVNVQYKVVVYASGNPSNTIASESATLAFHMLTPMESAVITQDTLTTSTANARIYGIGLYFVNLDNNPSANKYQFYSGLENGAYNKKQMSISLTDLNLKPGKYNVYGRFIGVAETQEMTATSALTKINTMEVEVASPVNNNTTQMTSDGILTFNKISDISEYSMTITRTPDNPTETNKTVSFQKTILAESSTTITITLDVYQIIKEYLGTTDDVTEGNLEEVFKTFTSSSTISITITSIGKEGVGVNSSPTTPLKFKRFNTVEASTISLSDSTATITQNINGETKTITRPSKTLTFTSTNDSGMYVIKIGDRSFTTPSAYNSGSTVSINLGEALVYSDELGNKTYLLDCINQSGDTTITIWAIGGGARANNSIGFVNSYAISKDFACTSTISNLNMSTTEVGNLRWKLNENLDNQTFLLNFYTKVGDNWQVIDGYANIKINASKEIISSGEDEGEEENLATLSSTTGEYFVYNIASTIQGLSAGDVIAVTVTHVMTERFTNVESNKYYVIQLEPVTITRVLDSDTNSTPSVTFQAEEGIKYSIVVNNKVDSSEVYSNTYENNGTVTIHLNNLGLTNAGDYSISIYAYKESTNTENTENNPYTFSGNVNALDISIVNKNIIARANGEYISWDMLNTFVTYNVQYKTSSGEYTYILENEETKVFTNDNLTHNVWQLFNAGINTVKIIPIVDYVTSGVYLVGNESETEIRKLNTITANVTTVTDGVIHYTLNDTFDNDNYEIIIKVGNDKLLDGEYLVDKKKKTISILSSKYIGEKSYEIQLAYPNTISSEYSTPFTAIKVSSVGDIAKEGEWVTFTPVAGANKYTLTFLDSNNSIIAERNIKYEGTNVWLEKLDEVGTWEQLSSDVAKIDDGKIYINFYAKKFGLEVTTAGIYNLALTPYATASGYLNGNISSNYKIAKLSNTVNMSISGDSFVVSNYSRSEDTLQTPEKIYYQIVYSKDINNEYNKNTSWTDISWEFDTTKYDNATSENPLEVLYTAKFSTDNKEFTQTYSLTYNGTSTPTIQLIEVGESGNTYTEVSYFSIVDSTSEHKKYTITLNARHITSESIKTALGSETDGVEPDKVTISFVESKVVFAKTELFSLVNIEGVDENGENNSYTISLNSDTLALYEDGEYQLKLAFLGNDNEVISSDFAESEIYTKLPAPTLYTKEGVLSWSEISNAQAYTLKISCDPQGGEIEEPEISTWTFENYTFTASDTDVSPNIDELSLSALNETFLGFKTGRNYYVQILATSSNNLSSKWSDVFTIQKLLAPTEITVKSTGNSIVNGGETTYIGEPLVTWSDPNLISNRPNYTMWIGDTQIDIANTGELSGQLIETNLVANSYEIAMATVGNTTFGHPNKIGLLTSDRSVQNPQVNYVTETINVSFDNNSFTWVPVTGAYTYKLTFFEGQISSSEDFATVTKVFTTFTTSNSYEFSSSEFDGNGYFTVLINAYCDPNKAIVSTYVEKDEEGHEIAYNCTNCASIYKSSSITNLMVKDGLLTWSIEMDDIKAYLDVHPEIENDLLMTYFGEKITGTTSTQIREQLLTEVIEYIKNKINEGVAGDDAVNNVLSNLYTFKAIINGTETVVKPTSISTINISTTESGKEYNDVPDANSARYLMFQYDLTNEPVSNESATSEFVFQVAPKGNYLDSNNGGLFTTVDGKFTSSITVYKPQTPTAVNVEEIEGESEEGETISGGTRKQIFKGNIYWALVTTEDSSLEGGLKYHNKYKLVATSQENIDNKITRAIDITDTEVESDGNISNPNLLDNINYWINLKELLYLDSPTNEKVTPNVSYKLKLNVMGTEDSTLLSDSEKIYLNSNAFDYTDILNILNNIGSEITGGKYTYTPCSNISTQTDVYVYGPFVADKEDGETSGKIIYAPVDGDETTYSWPAMKVKGRNFTARTFKEYADALKYWKELINPIWEVAQANSWRGEYESLRHVEHFAEEASGSGIGVTVSRISELNLTGDTTYGAGSYIIRKQEIGNGRGIIDTEYTDKLKNGTEFLDLDYEVIGTKLGDATKSLIMDTSNDNQLVENSIWVEDGKFVWKKVDRANAYRIVLEKLDGETLQLISGGIKVTTQFANTDENKPNESYEMPEDFDFNVSECVYRITITATHMQADGSTISHYYFEGEDVTTDAYGRSPVPDNLKVNESGILSWSENTFYSNIKGYHLKVNMNDEPLFTSEKSYDLSTVENGSFTLRIRAVGETNGESSYLNSCYNPAITIIKLANPEISVSNGKVIWNTETSTGTGEQQAKTQFKLSSGSSVLEEELLDSTIGSYILHSEISSFEADYSPSQEIYSANTSYTFGIKYQGTPTTTIANSSTNRQIIIASNEKTLTATKLNYPELTSVDVFSNNLSENRIRWSSIENAGGYRALVITQQNGKDIIYDISEMKGDSGYYTSYTIYEDGNVFDTDSWYRANSATDDKYYFVYNNATSQIDLRLSKLLKLKELNTTNGLSLDVYVQAIGTKEATNTSDNIYISGSFSARKKVEIPPMPTGIAFDSTTGTLSWETNESAGHNARITMSYTVNNVSKENFAKWKETADTIKMENGADGEYTDNSAKRYDEIKSRNITYIINSDNETDTYTLKVDDTIFLNAITSNGKKYTPTSYQVTSIGTMYNFTVRILVGGDTYQGLYMSEEATLNSTEATPYNFQVFAYGTGSEALPYGINNSAMFNSIRYYTSANYVITEDISFESEDNWQVIEQFSGTIDGGNNSVEYLTPSSISEVIGDTTMVYQAIFKENSGTIKNLNISVNNMFNGNVYDGAMRLAGLAITNTGTIDNVHITTWGSDNNHISAKFTGSLKPTRVAGMVNENSGRILNSSVVTTSTISALDDNSGVNKSTYVAGIANINSGTIDNSYFSGNLEGNVVGGITNENGGTISNSYSLGTATVTDKGIDSVNKGTVYGGIASTVYGNTTIENCYSRMDVVVDIAYSESYQLIIGGLVGQIDNKTGTTNNIVIKNSYVIFTAKVSRGQSLETAQVFVFAPYDSDCTYSNNYYLIEKADEIIEPNKTTVDYNAENLESLCSNMISIKDANNNSIYTCTVEVEEDEEVVTKTSKYPMLISNKESTIVTSND